ncbi:putative fatty acyl-CoA reductase CG5065 isoform X1 [Ostrinia furnacalis]|uniref:putative fatty acyl-CoA reductase CG5065 isoform X1 n=1 Tax=Ostrinia furnacalis TaxID=93504 RepID=UPI00103DCF7F|nr:putative fatty acyl-CoA reductase CG5065 isoform X1 [Ostrinia furnacalis]
MFNGITQAVSFGLVLTKSCKKSLKLSYNVTTILTRTRSTAIDHNQSVSDFYAGKSVFITGGTGFLGKAYIETLLRNCEDIDKIFILIREKKGESIENRVKHMVKNPIFGKVRNTKPQVFDKIVPIIGDICLPKLGISSKDEQTLRDQVSVVFHSAATVKFNEPLEVAMNINFEGTRRIVDLCKGMRKCENFVYISTAFSQTMYDTLEEKVYPAPAKVEEIYEFMKKYPNDVKKTMKYIGKHPSTYTFTKCLAENYIATDPVVPTTIVRPSVVNSTYRDPVPGWLDNWYSVTGVSFDVARGLNHYFIGNKTNVFDAIPVDYVSNCTIVAGARYTSENGIVPVYNSTSSGSNPILWMNFHEGFIRENMKFGYYERKPYFSITESKIKYKLLTLLRMKIPAHTADLMLRIQGKNPRHVKLLKRVLATRSAYDNFQLNNWVFKNDRARELYASLSDADKAKFPCNPNDIDWDEYIKIFFKGVRQYLLSSLIIKENEIYPRRVK